MKKDDRFSTVRFDVRERLNISVAEYCLCDMVYHLSNSRKSKKRGWATAQLSYYAQLIGVTKRGIMKMRDRMVEHALIEKDPDNKNRIRTTLIWEEIAIEGVNKVHFSYNKKSEQSSPKNGTKFTSKVNKVHLKSEQSSPPSNKYTDKDKDKDSDSEGSRAPNIIEIPIDFEPFEIEEAEVLEIGSGIEKEKKVAPKKEKDPETSREVIRQLDSAGLNGDCITSRMKIWDIVEPYLESEEFKNQWQFTTQGLPDVPAQDVVREWITLASYYDVKNFKINRIRNWAKNFKPVDNGKDENVKGERRIGIASEETIRRSLAISLEDIW